MTPQLLLDCEKLESAARETTECSSDEIIIVKFAVFKMYVLKMETGDVHKVKIGTSIGITGDVSWLVIDIEPPAMGERVDLMEEAPDHAGEGRLEKVPKQLRPIRPRGVASVDFWLDQSQCAALRPLTQQAVLAMANMLNERVVIGSWATVS